MHQGNRYRVVALERQNTCDHFKHGDTQRVNITLFIHIAASRLFRGEIMDRTSRIGCCCHSGCSCRSGNTEVCYLQHTVCAHQNVLGFDISMYNVRFMSLTQRRCDLNCHIDGRTGIERRFFLDRLFQCIPVDIFVYDIVYIAVFANIICSYDIGMGQSCCRAGFRTETFDELFIAHKFLSQNLQRYITIQFFIFASIYHSHAAGTDFI